MAGTTVKSLARGMHILQALARSDDGLRLSEVAGQLDLKPPTAHNLLRTLVGQGWAVRREPGPRYALGPAALALADAHRERLLVARAEEHVRALAREYHSAVVTYAEPVGLELDILLRAAPEQPGLVQRPRDRSFNPYGTASGLVMLAHSTEEERQAVFSRFPFSEYGASLWDSVEALTGYLARVREDGHAAPRLKNNGLCIVAAPVLSDCGMLLGVLGMAAPFGDEDERKAIERDFVDAAVEHAAALNSEE